VLSRQEDAGRCHALALSDRNAPKRRLLGRSCHVMPAGAPSFTRKQHESVFGLTTKCIGRRQRIGRHLVWMDASIKAAAFWRAIPDQ